MSETVLTTRDLNRALLARQMLLAREKVTPTEALHRLVAQQGQMARAPFIGLWTRLKAFPPAELRRLIVERQVVRSTFVRSTLHLTTADDFLALRPALRATLGRDAPLALPGGIKVTPDELEPILALARVHFAETPRPFESLREVIEAAGHGDVRIMALAARILLPLVQASDSSEFGYKAGGEFVTAKAWLGCDVAQPDPKALIRRYLAAYGPATPADFATWSGEKAAAGLFDSLGDELVRYRDEKKRVLFDLKDAPLPDPDTPAPPRLLPDFDAAVLGHQDRSRIVPPGHVAKAVTSKNLLVPPMALVNGFVAATWRLDIKKKTAALAIRAFEPIKAKDKAGLEAEALDLMKVFAPGAAAAVSFEEV